MLERSIEGPQRVLISRKAYVFNTPYRWGRPVENEWYDISEPWSTHWASVLFDRNRGDPLNMSAYSFLLENPPELMPTSCVAFPADTSFLGYWKVPLLSGQYYFSAEVKVIGSDEVRKVWFELTDEEEERLWERYLYNDMFIHPELYA